MKGSIGCERPGLLWEKGIRDLSVVATSASGCLLAALVFTSSAAGQVTTNCDREELFRLGDTPIFRPKQGNTAVFFAAGMSVDADGAPNAYCPEGKGLDYLSNAGHAGRWWGIATRDGEPLLQGPADPAPGCYISVTSLTDRTRPLTDPRRYVDATRVPYVVLPRIEFRQAADVQLGDIVIVFRPSRKKWIAAIYADSNPRVGEGSIALARALGGPANPRRGGITEKLLYVVFPRSGSGAPLVEGEIAPRGEELLRKWGGDARLAACAVH